jgi:hypothetical protein
MYTNNNARRTSILAVTVPNEGIFLENKCFKSISAGKATHEFE